MPAGAVLKLELEQKYKRQLQASQSHDLALLAFLGVGPNDDCDTPHMQILQASWNRENMEKEAVVLLNSNLSSPLLFVWQSHNERPTKYFCDRIQSDQNIAFDTVCSIPSNATKSLIKIGIGWRDGSNAMRRLEYEIN